MIPFEILAYPAVFVVSLTSLILLLQPGWRIGALMLAIQYGGVFLLLGLSWPIGRALSLFVAGLMATFILVLARLETSIPAADERPGRGEMFSARIFRFLAASMMILVIVSLAPTISEWIPAAQVQQSQGMLVLTGLGLLMIGMANQPEQVVTGLLTILSGFQILYAVVESSALLAALLAAVHLGLAISGAYLRLVPATGGEA